MTKPKKRTRKSDAAAKRAVAAPAAAALPVLPEPEGTARLFGLRTILGRPVYLTRSDWLEHIPFAFWLMEAQAPKIFVEMSAACGVSYFAFCQAVERLGIDAACFSIRDWPEDDEGEAGMAQLERHNAAHYSAFSQILRGRHHTAPDYFEPGSVDLLHIDGLPGYDDAKGAFESWRPALSERAVAILHNTNVRSGGYGVARLLAELRRDHPVFEFKHGNGLAVVGVGPVQNEAFQRLYEAESDPAARTAIHNIFGRLGRACADSFDAREYQELYRQARAEAARIKAELDAAIAASPDAQAALSGEIETPGRHAAQERGDAGAEARAEALEREVAELRRAAETRDAEAASARRAEVRAAALADENRRLQEQLDAARAAAADPAKKAETETEIRTLKDERDDARRRVEAAEEELRRVHAGLQDRFEEIAALTRSIYELEEEKRGLQDAVANAERRAAAEGDRAGTLGRTVDELQQQIAHEAGQRAEFEHVVNELRNSTSWRVTAPLRALSSTVRRRH